MFGSGMSIMPRALSFCSLLLCTAGALAGIQYATLYWASEKTIKVKGALDRNGDAYGFYNDTIQSTGWGVLEIRAGYGTRVNKNNNIMFAAGYLEGYLTARHMYNHFANLYPQLINNASMQKPVEDFLWRQYQWTKKQITLNQDDPFWRHAGYVIAQLDGLHDGAAKWAKLHAQKVLPGFENVLFAHSSWYTYASTLRIYKHWDFNISDANTSTGKMSFSSYPGFLESLDDFYLLGSGLVMLQTTNSIFNKTLFEYMVPEALFTWQRVRIANMMADSGTTWALTFSRYNSGTYNSQYMILDWKKIKLEKSIDKGTLTIVEQVPTLVVYSDQTSILRKGYWPSYNIPFHEIIYNISGYPDMVEHVGNLLSYDLAPRASIFRRDQAKVVDMESLKYIMRYNNYRADPYAKNNSCNTICCRGDLVPVSPSPFGCYDSKVADITLASQFTAFAINGPTVEDGLPAFRWSRFNETVHQGLPEVYNFSFVKMKPIL
ncbi:phospholipase B-like 1 isoform X2 [Microcaecilia unicolor]|uniref:Phospholipase B-like n=1 Tax=Microcaecilia unicolor TaxID=1415580 RepID=A0A6P7YD99_9AMPH|nr:phospholipase B-like 1 isoform X2 [Microcaecilia unicolor]